jgi:pimeloyl-ACP methyl ester carboxylesterase
MAPHRKIFNIAMTGISRVLLLREHALGRIGPGYRGGAAGVIASHQNILRGGIILDAVFVEPEIAPANSAVVLCHGIGEVVDEWFPVQALLAQHGVGSLVFDYSGYGRSGGAVDWTHWEDDAVAAFECLQRLVSPMPVSILGFSMGSGVAAAVVCRIPANRLILCASFTSFRAGAHSLGLPARALPLVPPIWTTDETLAECTVPVLLVHGDKDQLFPVQMARDLAALLPESKLVVVKNLSHSEPFHKPQISYWGHVVRFLAG